MDPAEVKPTRRHRRAAASKAGLRKDDAPRVRHDDRGRHITPTIATGKRQKFRGRDFDIGTAAVMLVLTRGNGQRPRAVMSAGRLAVLGLRGCMLMPPTEAQHSHAASAAGEGMERDDRDKQNGEWTITHGGSVTRLQSSVA